MKPNVYYRNKINIALNHIQDHLGEPISIKDLASLTGISEYHFIRIFKSLLTETPYELILRKRLEHAVFLLKYHNQLKIQEIAYKSGFSSPENFSRQFKSRFQISPSTFRQDPQLQKSRIYQENNPEDFYVAIEKSRSQSEPTNYTVALDELPEIPIALVKAIYGSDGTELMDKYLHLITWAQENQLNFQGPLTRFGMSIDNPDVTPASKYRYDFALRIDDDHLCSGIIEKQYIPAGLYATIHCQGDLQEVSKCWDYLYQNWLPNSTFRPRHFPAMEEFIKGPEEIGWTSFNLKCRIPIEPIH